jgi:uncharacterized damage-inducible protein DinB
MNAKDMVRSVLGLGDFLLSEYLKDLSDEDLLVRPMPGINPAAWQLGHLIASEADIAGRIPGAFPTTLSAEFLARHSAERASDDGPGLLGKAELVRLREEVRAATLALLDRLPDDQLDAPSGWKEMEMFAPTVGALFALLANHDMMHIGQLPTLRRKLGKPVVV